MKKHQLVPLLLLVSTISGGQTMVDVRTQTKNVDFSGAASTIPARSGSSVPTSCKVGEMFFNTANAPGQNLYLCAPANTWTILAGGTGGSTVGTILTATGGQFAFYATNGSTVSGHSLNAADIPALSYQAPLTFTGNGTNTASSTGSTTANDCAKWDANGNIIDAGSPCGTGSGAATFGTLAGGTNTSAVLIIGSGASLAASGTGSISATSVPASGVIGLAPSATTDTTNANNITSGALSAARLPLIPASGVSGLAASATTDATNATNITTGTLSAARLAPIPVSGVTGLAASATTDTTNAANITTGILSAARLPSGLVTTSSATGSGAKFASAASAGQSNDCAKWDANGNVIDAGAPCNSAAVLQSSTHVAEGDSITYGYETTGTCNGAGCNYASLLAFDERATLTNRGVSGYQACDVAARQTMINDLNASDNNSIYTLLIGTNDANVKGVGAYESVFKQCHQAVIAWNATPNKYAANSVNCTNTGTWTATTAWALNGDYSFTNGSTKTCPVTTYGGPIYAWYYIGDNNTGAFTYSVDSGAAVALTTATTPAIATQNFPSSSYGWSLIRVPVSAGVHSIKFTVTSPTGTGTNQAINIGAIGTPPAQSTYGQPKVFVSGIPRQEGDANSATTAQYDSDVRADASLLASDGLGVYFVNVRNYLCTNIIGGFCYNPTGTAQDMVGNNSSNPVENSEDMLHPNNLGHNEIKQAFEAVMQFTPYVAPYTGNGGKAVTSTGAGVSGNCAKWDANGNVVDAGAACGAGSGGSGSASWASLTSGTNTSSAFVLGSGASLSATGTGAITATSVPASGISGTIPATLLPVPTTSSLGGVQSAAAVSHQWINSISAAGVPALSQPAFTDVSGTVADTQLPGDQCTLTKYTVTGTQLAALASATPTVTLFAMPSTSTRICLVEIAGTTSFTGTNITAATVRLQSGAATPLLYSPNQDVFGTVGPTTNNFWTDSGNMADRTNQNVVAAFTFTGATSAGVAPAASVSITVGTRTMP